MEKLNFDISANDLERFENCIACGEEDFVKISDCELKNHVLFFSTVICNNCCHVYRNITPSENWFRRNFKKRHEFQKKNQINPFNPNIEKDRYIRYKAIGSFIKNRYPKLNSLLDVGCGPGTGFDALSEIGFEVEGIESDNSRSIIARNKGYKIYEGDWQTFRTSKSFDIITAIHSLEHFHAPEEFLKQMTSFSNSDTILYLEVPEILDHVKDWNDSLYLAHLSNFNTYSLEILAVKCGWELIEQVHPYKNTELHKGHISMIFKRNEGKNLHIKNIMAGDEKKLIKENIIRLYKNGLPPNIQLPIHFELNQLNDLSLAFKKITKVKEKVHENYDLREIVAIKESRFLIK